MLKRYSFVAALCLAKLAFAEEVRISIPVVTDARDVPAGHCAFVLKHDGRAWPMCRNAQLVEVIAAFNRLQRTGFVKGDFTGCSLRITATVSDKRDEFMQLLAVYKPHLQIGPPEDGAPWVTCRK